MSGRGQGGFKAWASAKDALDRKLGDAVKPWVLHDLRRVVSTTMHERLKVPPHIVEACLGHYASRAGVSGVYNRAQYAEEKRIALNKWAGLLERIVSGGSRRPSSKMPKRR